MRKRLPEWIKRGIIDTEATKNVRSILKEYQLNTVCDNARCPNKGECYSNNTATFLLMGNICTRNCRFCSVTSSIPEPLNTDEPEHIALAVEQLKLKYVVLTSVTRDDLEDGGAKHFADTINAIRNINTKIRIEVLTPDFQGNKDSILKVLEAGPDVFNHNIETVKRLYNRVRPQADYLRSLEFLKFIKEKNPSVLTKTGIMVGLGETFDDIKQTFVDLKSINTDIVTIGQYIQPTKEHLEVDRYLTPEEFTQLKNIGLEIGLNYIESAPLVRSSYNAFNIIKAIEAN